MRIEREVYEKYVKSYAPEQVVFQEGEPGEEMYIIIDGEVEIRKRTSAKTSKTLVNFHNGDIFGEMALIEKKPRSATAITTRSTRVLVMNEALLDRTLERNPDFARKIIRILSERLRRANAIIQSMTITNRQNQILSGLLQYAREKGTSTFKGQRVAIDEFAGWAGKHLGIPDRDVRASVQELLKRGLVNHSAKGREEILVDLNRPTYQKREG